MNLIKQIYLLCFTATVLSAQTTTDSTSTLVPSGNQVQIIYADKTTGTKESRILSGNVHLKQKDTELWANEVVQLLQKGEIELRGNVRIKQGNDSLYADFIRYYENTKVADATGNIRFTNGTNTVFAPSGRYFTDEKKVEFNNGARILDDESVLTSQSGTYFTQTRTGDFVGNVNYNKGKTQVRANRGNYRADEKRSFFEENVQFSNGNATVFANKGMYDEGQQYADFEGNVRFESKGAKLFADKGKYQENTQIADFEGNVRYEKGTQKLTAISGQYLEIQQEATFKGNVVYQDKTLKITADEALVYQEEERTVFKKSVNLADKDLSLKTEELTFLGKTQEAIFPQKVFLTDEKGTLTADRGNYGVENKQSRFFGNIKLTQKDFYLEADTLSNFKNEAQSFAYGNVFIKQNSKENLKKSNFIWGNQLTKDDKNGLTRIQRNPVLLQINSEKAIPDSLWIKADILQFVEKENNTSLIADKRVSIHRKGFAALTDSLFTQQQDSLETFKLIGNSVAWQEDLQLSGDQIYVYRRNNQTDSLRLFNALIAQEDSTLKTFRQLKGKQGFGNFQADSLRQLHFSPQAELLDFVAKDGLLDKALKVTADVMTFQFAKGQLTEMDAIGNVQGKLYEKNLIPDKFQLDGFVWRINERPNPKTFLALIRPIPALTPTHLIFPK